MGAFVIAARIGVVNETFIKIGVEDTVASVVDQSVSDTSFVNVSPFGVGHNKMFVAAVSI